MAKAKDFSSHNRLGSKRRRALKYWMTQQNLTAENVAEMIDASKQTIQKWLRDGSNPRSGLWPAIDRLVQNKVSVPKSNGLFTAPKGCKWRHFDVLEDSAGEALLVLEDGVRVET